MIRDFLVNQAGFGWETFRDLLLNVFYSKANRSVILSADVVTEIFHIAFDTRLLLISS